MNRVGQKFCPYWSMYEPQQYRRLRMYSFTTSSFITFHYIESFDKPCGDMERNKIVTFSRSSSFTDWKRFLSLSPSSWWWHSSRWYTSTLLSNLQAFKTWTLPRSKRGTSMVSTPKHIIVGTIMGTEDLPKQHTSQSHFLSWRLRDWLHLYLEVTGWCNSLIFEGDSA